MAARNDITQEMYDAFCAAFRKFPANITHAANVAKTARATARKAWNHGWPSKGFRSIKEQLDLEALEARAARQRAADDARRKEIESRAAQEQRAKDDAVQALAAEGAAVVLLRGNALAINAMTAQLLQTAQAVSAKLSGFLMELVAKIDAGNAASADLDTLSKCTRILDRLVRTCGLVTESALTSERIRLGQPLHHAGVESDGRTVEEILADLSTLLRAATPPVDLPVGTAQLVPDTAAIVPVPRGANGHGNGV